MDTFIFDLKIFPKLKSVKQQQRQLSNRLNAFYASSSSSSGSHSFLEKGHTEIYKNINLYELM
jgi:hypothetical protein